MFAQAPTQNVASAGLPVLGPHRAHAAPSLDSPRTHLRPRAAGPDVSTRKNSTHSSSSNYMYEQTRRRCESWLGRLSTRTSITLHHTHRHSLHLLQVCSPRPGSGPARARACLGLGMPLQLRFYNHGTLSTSQPVHNSSDPSWCAERGSDADPCHRIAARPSPQTSTAPRHPWTSFAFCSLRRGPT